MPNKRERIERYLKQASSNEELFLYFREHYKKKCYFPWVFVFAYYSCLQYLYAFLVVSKKSIPKSHQEAISIAKKSFYTQSEKITTSSGTEFGQLHKYSQIARYRPEDLGLISDNALVDEAEKIITNCKIIAFNECGVFCTPSPKRKIIQCFDLSDDYIIKLEAMLRKL